MTDVTENKLGEEPLTQEGKFEGQKLEEIVVVNEEALEVFEFVESFVIISYGLLLFRN